MKSNIKSIASSYKIALASVTAILISVSSYADGGRAQAIAASLNHSLVLKTDGTLWSFGANQYGQLGLGTTTDTNSKPAMITSLGNDVKAIAAGTYHSFALKTDGTLWAFGANWAGQLGLGTTADAIIPTRVASLGNDVKAIAAGPLHTLVLKNDGSLWVFGNNEFGQLGLGNNESSSTAIKVASLGNSVKAIAAGGWYSLALKTDGTLWAFGANGAGQLGLGTSIDLQSPKQVMGAVSKDVVAIATGEAHSLVLKKDGTLWAFGSNHYGQLALGNIAKASVATKIDSLGNDVIAIAAGDNHSLALKRDGTLWAFGNNSYSQLGLGTTADSSKMPARIAGLASVKAIAAGGYYSLALKNDGSVWAFGSNEFGQLGLGTTKDTSVPARVYIP